MKSLVLLSFLFAIIMQTTAQPAASAVVKRLTHTGVIKVEVVKTAKEWHNSKYVYVAYANVIKAVPPEQVDGLKGVTLVIATMAYYDIGASQPYQVLGSESNGEYRGINLPFPSNTELQEWGTMAAKESPEKFFLQGNSILGIEQIKVTQPKCVWLHPRRLKFQAKAIYVERLTSQTIQQLNSRCEIELHRDGLNAPWYLGKAEMQTNESRYIGEPIHISDAPQWKNQPTLTERKASPIAAPAVAIPVFASGQEMGLYLLAQLHAADQTTARTLLSNLFSSDLKNPGGASLNGNGDALLQQTLNGLYYGWGKYKDQYCAVPAKTEIWANELKFYNKTGTRYSQLSFKKENNTYTLEDIRINKEETEEANAQLKAQACVSGTANAKAATAGFQKGQQVLVEENGKWYPATVLEVRSNEWFIHYEGYSSQYDLWVGPARIKAR